MPNSRGKFAPMNSTEESLATWSTFIGTLVSLFGLIQSQAWLAVVGGVFAGTSIVALLYARSESLVVESARVRIGGRSIDSLNVANLGRRVNRTLVVQAVDHIARIEGENIQIQWGYSGYCRAPQETAMEFSVDSDNNVPFADLDCFAYDLERDPEMKHKIRPLLADADGLSKKIAVPFLAPLAAQEPFNILLRCRLDGCVKPGVDYHTSTLSFEQEQIRRYTQRLIFSGRRPEWVRVYGWRVGAPKLLKDLRPNRECQDGFEYVDIAENVPGRAARIYVFLRAS